MAGKKIKPGLLRKIFKEINLGRDKFLAILKKK